MAPSRKQQREIDRLKGDAQDLLDDQKEVLQRASRVIRAASRHARNEAISRGHDAFNDRVRPAVSSALATGVSAGKDAAAGIASSAREHISDDVLPAVSSALGSALAVLDSARTPDVSAAVGKASKAGRSAVSKGRAVAAKTGVVKAKPSAGPGRYILIAVGVVALAGIAYAAWQTLRADDDLWIDDEELTEPTGDVQPS